jgi:hypothetical protein
MNSPLGNRKVRLRGLGGQALRGVPRTCASATGDCRISFSMGINRGNDFTLSASTDHAIRTAEFLHWGPPFAAVPAIAQPGS